MTILIGFTGKAGSGKDTAANYLKMTQLLRSVAFADPIREAMRVFGLNDAHFQHPHKEAVLPEFGKSPRQMMQTLGTEWARECVHKDFWLILAGKKIDEYQKNGYHVAVTDVRFENEAEFIRNRGGTIIHVVRPDAATTPHAHASEAGVKQLAEDYVITNDGTIADLNTAVKAAFYYAENFSRNKNTI